MFSRVLRNAAFLTLLGVALANGQRARAMADVCDSYFPGCYCFEGGWSFDVSCDVFPDTCEEADPGWCGAINDACYAKCGFAGIYDCGGMSSYECEGWCLCDPQPEA